MAVREIIKNKKYKIELFIGRNGNKKIMHYEIVNGGKKEAILRENELKLQIQNNTFIKNNKITVKSLMLEYEKYNLDKWSPATHNAHKARIRNIIDKIGHIELKTLNVKVLEEFYRTLKDEKNYSNKSIVHHYNLINGALKKAITWNYISYNINSKIEKPKIRQLEVECYSPDEVEKLLNVLQYEPLKYQALIYLALDSGARRGEIVALNWNDIDFNNNQLTINKSLQHTKELGTFEKQTKTKTSDRKIFISDTTIKILKQYKIEQNSKRLLLGNKWIETNRIFTTEYGGNMNVDTPSYIFKKIIRKYGLKKIKFHALRHTSISLMISKGIQAQIISRRAGHSSIQTTHSIYSHFFNEEFKECANVMNDILKYK